jgi:hypothetical protein
MLQKSDVGPDDIPDVQHVAHGFEISGANSAVAGSPRVTEALEERGHDI